jgi:hypothetical protein
VDKSVELDHGEVSVRVPESESVVGPGGKAVDGRAGEEGQGVVPGGCVEDVDGPVARRRYDVAAEPVGGEA